MKKLLAFLFLSIALPVFAQDGTIINHNSSIILDSTATGYLYQYFTTDKFFPVKGFYTSAQTPENKAMLTNHFYVSGYIDSLKASGTKDSLAVGFIPFNASGYVVDDTLWVDFANHDSATVKQYFSWATNPWNRGAKTLGASSPTFWANLSGLLKPGWFGGKWYFEQVTTASSADSNRVTIDATHGAKQ